MSGRLHHDHRGVATGGRANGYANVVSAAAHISNDSRSHLLGMPVHDRFEANWKVATTDRFWPDSNRRFRRSPPARRDYTSVCSAISNASSTSTPRYLTILSSLL